MFESIIKNVGYIIEIYLNIYSTYFILHLTILGITPFVIIKLLDHVIRVKSLLNLLFEVKYNYLLKRYYMFKL